MPGQEIKREEEKTRGIVKEKDLFVWTAPSRPFKRRNREFYITVIAMAAVVGLILFVAEGSMPVILLASLIFLFYVLNTVEPEVIEYKITDKGVKIADKRTDWEQINRFWFSKRYDSALLIFETLSIPGRLEFVINKENMDTIKEALEKYTVEEKVPPSAFDRVANWISNKLPGN